MDSKLADTIIQCVHQKNGQRLPRPQFAAVSGGDICQSYRLSDKTSEDTYFIKVQDAHFLAGFISEHKSLSTIKRTNTLHTPSVIDSGKTDKHSFLLMNYLSLKPSGDYATLGRQLASMHRHTHNQFGFASDNFLGLSIQKNRFKHSWADFWREQRLQMQLELAYKHHFLSELKPQEKDLLHASDQLLENHSLEPSLVHGDLWGGNKAFLADNSPVIFDPAAYYGDREVDIAMTQLFGGFSDDFYRAYHQAWPLPKGAKKRLPLYNLYHQLNHLNLFGRQYLSSCLNSIESIINSSMLTHTG